MFIDPNFITDGTVAMGCAIFLLCFPATPPAFILDLFRTFLLKINYYSLDHQALNSQTNHSTHNDDGVELGSVVSEQQESKIGFDNDNVNDSTNIMNDTTVTQEINNKENLLSWSAVQNTKWDIIFLLGGGFALSKGFEQSGLSEWLAGSLININLCYNFFHFYCI
jgi:hypothetical protein